MDFYRILSNSFMKIIFAILGIGIAVSTFFLFRNFNFDQYRFLLFLDYKAMFLIFTFCVSILGLSIIACLLVIRANKIRQFGTQKDSWLKEKFKIFLGLQKEKDCVEEYFNATNFMLKSFLKNTSSYKYELPWYITFGAIDSGKSSFMNAITLHRPLEMNIDSENFLNHYFFNNGIVIDVKTELIYNESTHDFSWEGLVNNLKKNRNEKSIDGVLYFVSLKDLYEDFKSGNNQLKKQSEILYSKLWYMQNKFEMKIPVYIIFTNLDYLDGFKEFIDIFQDYSDDIFGWSNPHSIDSQFDEIWLDEMFVQLNSSLKFIQSEMMVNFSDEVSFDMMNFINNFKDMQSKIFSFLKSTFKLNKYSTGLYFRGVYFTALDYSRSQSNQLPFLNQESVEYSQTIVESKKLYFGNDLLDKKIFLEKNIGKSEMDRRTLMNNLKKFKIFNLVFSIAAIFYSYKVYNDCLYIEDSIQPKILKVIELINQSEYDADFNQSKEFKDELKLLLIYLEELARYDLSFYGVPSSWLCSVNRNKNKLFFKAYNKLIVENLVKEIVSKYQVLAKKRFVVSYDLDTGLISPLEMNEFKNLNSLIEDLSRLEMYEKNMKAILEYNSVSNLKDLLFDIYNIEVPLHFAKKIMYANSSEDYEILRYKIVLAKVAIKKKFQWCIDQFDANCFSSDRIRKYFADLSRFLLLVDHNSNVLNIENIKSIQLSMTNLITFLNSLESKWLKLKHFSLEKYVELLDKISVSETLSVSEDFFKRIEASYSRFKKELSRYQLPIIGSPLYLSANRSIEISPSVLNIHGILNNIFSESFMIMPNCKTLTEAGKGEFIKWNAIELEEISNIIKDYIEFIEMKSSNKFEECVKKIARNNIIDVIEHKLCKAKKVVIFKNDKSYLSDLSNNIKKNSQYMFEILHFVKKNNSDFFIRLKTIEKENLSNYLQSVDINLERDNLYQITKETLGLDINEQRLYYKMNLAEYLVAQKDLLEFYIRDLASDAIKGIEYIKHLENGKISMLVSKFKGLEISLDNYKLNPSSSELYKLEQFLGKVHSTSLSLLMTDLNKDSKILSANRYLENKLIITRKIINEFLYDSIINLVDNQYQVGKDFFKEYASTFPFSLNGELIGLKGYETMDYLSKKQRAVLDVIYIIDPKFKPRTVEFVDTLAKCSKLIHYIKTDEEYMVMKFKPYQSIGELYERNLKYLIDFSAKVSGQKPITLYWVGELKIYDTLEFDVELARNSNVKFSGVKDKEGYTLVNNTTLRLKLNRKQLVRFLLENIKIINNQSFIRFTIGIEDDKGIRDKMVIMMPVDLTLDGLPFNVPQKSFRKLLGDVI